jgi:UDP-N-acetylglucosamine--N-acetylmuramyl-(pentapeptide) pyrophosphoryl-undecaprenol N-acetylglucosamine transferase
MTDQPLSIHTNMKVLISGGGTGGHIFPAVSIANALRELDPSCEILFIGAEGRVEMERVPQSGYPIVGLPVRGLDRKKIWRNIGVAIDFVRSMRQVRRIIRDFRPDVGVGVGGYASGAAMKVAARMGVPILLQEQNGFAGVTNKMLRNDAAKICVAYEGMERFFPADKLILTGNPVRQNLKDGTPEQAIQYFNDTFGVQFTTQRKTLLIIGGSLGARTINDSMKANLKALIDSGIQVIWQTGKYYFEDCKQALNSQLSTLNTQHSTIICTDFISQMPQAYALADVVISRAGASSISELCLLGKASVLVPSPNVAEDHQTHNAMALVRRDAAILVKDVEALDKMVPTALELIKDDNRIVTLEQNILTLALPDSANLIAKEVIKLANT